MNPGFPLGSTVPPRARRTVTLLPEVDTCVDPANPTQSFAGHQLVISAENNKAQRVAYVRFDLGPIPSTATIVACQFYFTVDGSLAKQIVKLLLVDDDTWAGNFTFDTAPKPTATAIGTWLAETTPRVTTNADNPVLVREVQRKLGAGQHRRLSLKIISAFGLEGFPTSNTYYSFEVARDRSEYAAGPRLVVQYEPAAQPVTRDWAQRQADHRHSGRSPWVFANTPTKSYEPATSFSGQVSSPVVVRDGLLYLFLPTELRVMDPARGTWQALASDLAEFHSLALGPDGLLYAAAKTELAAFDLAGGGKKTISVPLSNSSAITAGADGSVYLAQGSTLFSYVRYRGTLAPAWSRDMKTDLLSPVTLNADGSVALIATASQLFALDSADGSALWTFPLPAQARHLTTPVAGRGNGLSYFGVDDTLYVFRDSNVPNITPQNTLRVVEGIKLSQPVIDLDDTLYALQGTELYTVSPDGTGGPTKSVTTPNIAAISPVEPLMDGAGNLFIIDNRNTLFVFNRDLELGNGPQVLPFSGLRPGLQAAPNGSLFCNSDTALFRLTPDVASTVTVTSYADATSYRAASSLVLEGAALPAAASVVFESGDTITIKPFFSVPLGTEAVFTTES